MTPAAAPLRMADLRWRGSLAGSTRARGVFRCDWQIDEGCTMDAPIAWQPAGGTRATVHMQGTDCTYALRSGHAWVGDMDPAVQMVYPTVRGVRYRCRLERGLLAWARAEVPRARQLRSGSSLYYEVEKAAWLEAA